MLRVQVVWMDDQGQVQEKAVQLPADACLQDAFKACQLLTVADQQNCGVWGRNQALDYRLQEGDRAELYQPLKVDPKVARRERFAKQGARSAGLFAKRRPNSKAGY